MARLTVSSRFDSGNIDVVAADEPSDIRLRIRRDVGDRHAQWFHFQLCNARDRACRMTIENAGEMSYPSGFEDYQAAASVDGETWVRVPTSFDGTHLVIEHTPDTDQVSYAYFAPYSFERHQWLVATASDAPNVRSEVLCWCTCWQRGRDGAWSGRGWVGVGCGCGCGWGWGCGCG